MITKSQQKLIRSLELKKYRQREGLFIAEGPKVVGDLITAGFEPEMILKEPSLDFIAANVQEVTADELRRISFLQHPQGVLGVFKVPSSSPDGDIFGSALQSSVSPSGDDKGAFGALLLALDSIQDPGNLGTIIRIADWFGIDAVYCSPDTADAWAPKVVQATMGSIARVPIIYCDLGRLLDKAANANVPIYGTLLDGENIYEQPLTKGGIIVMGNEGNGISEPIRRRITRRLLIPDFHQGQTADSLNVAIATAITCSEFRRRL